MTSMVKTDLKNVAVAVTVMALASSDNWRVYNHSNCQSPQTHRDQASPLSSSKSRMDDQDYLVWLWCQTLENPLQSNE